MLNWGFPDDLICCVLLHHRANQVWSLEPLRNTALPALAVTSWLPCVISPSTANLGKFNQFVTDNFRLDVAGLALSVEEQLRTLIPNLAGYTTMNQHLTTLAAGVEK
jgi:hypothetical protein